MIHLQKSLKDEARECGRSPTLQGVEDRLRSRFGMTPREARANLVLCKRANKTSLQHHADDVSHLVQRGYAELDNRQRRSLVVETFINSLGNPSLQRHLLAISPPELSSAIRACTEFLSVKEPGTSNVRQVEGDGENVQTLTIQDRESIDSLTTTVQELAKQVAGLQRENAELQHGRRAPRR